MAKGCYVGVNGIARKVKKGCVGVNGVARRIKKAYIGIGGVARPCWAGGEPTYYGEITPLGVTRRYMASTTFDNKALFIGGQQRIDGTAGTTFSSTDLKYSPLVDVYDTKLVRTNAPDLGIVGRELRSIVVGEHVLVTGAQNKTIQSYTKSFTLATLTATVHTSYASYSGIATVGDHALFVGGYYEIATTAISSDLTKVTIPTLSHARYRPTGSTLTDKALFVGGAEGTDDDGYNYHSGRNFVYNEDLTQSSFFVSDGKLERYAMVTATAGNHAIFVGGINDYRYDYEDYNIAIDNDLTITCANPSLTNKKGVPVSLDKYAFFSNGTSGAYAYDENLTETTYAGMSVTRSDYAGARTGDYAIFAGGYNANRLINAVEAYVVA